MKFLPQQSKYYKKTAALTDIIAFVIIWILVLNPPVSILSGYIVLVLNVWIWISGPVFTKLGEYIIKNRDKGID